MSRLAYEDLEIVGFDGTVLVECETVLPIARHKPSDQFFKLTTDNSHPDTDTPLSTQPLSELEVNLISFFSRDEIDAYIQEGRLTLLPEAVPAFAGAMVVYVNEEFLVAAGSQLPEPFYWQHLSPQTWVACGHQEVLEDLLNHWGTLLLGEATERLEQFFLENDQELCSYAEHLTDLALCAANDLTLRSRIYLRSGLAVMLSDIPERLDNLSTQTEIG